MGSGGAFFLSRPPNVPQRSPHLSVAADLGLACELWRRHKQLDPQEAASVEALRAGSREAWELGEAEGQGLNGAPKGQSAGEVGAQAAAARSSSNMADLAHPLMPRQRPPAASTPTSHCATQ